MTEEQYSAVQPWRAIIDRWAASQVYVGGGDGLMDVWDRLWSTKLNRQCSNCVADMLTVLAIQIKTYERENS